MPTFSIVTCTRNSLPFIKETVASVRAQTCSNYEHIFVDGASTDGTLDYLRTLGSEVRILTEVTGGIAKAMNAGIAAARGDFIVHLHSDDYFLHSRVLERVAYHFSQHPNAWLFGRIVNDVEGGLFPESYVAPSYSYKQLLKRNFIPHPATFIRREVFAEFGGFDESIRYAMDYDFWLRIGNKYPPLALREALSVFRRHEGSASQANLAASMAEDYSRRIHYSGGGAMKHTEHYIRYLVRKRKLGI